MFQDIIIRHFHPGYNIGLQNVRNAWLLDKPPVKLKTTTYRGNLMFRVPGSGKRISYRTLKKGLIKKTFVLRQSCDILPF